MSDGAIVVLVTAASPEEAETLSRLLLDQRLCACVTILPQATSLFRWQGAIDVARESLLIIKTTLGALSALTSEIKQHHSYQVPEVIALPIVGGNPDYLSWLVSETQPEPGRSGAR